MRGSGAWLRARRARPSAAIAAMLLAVAAIVAAVFAATSASAGSTSVAATAQKCGEDVVYPAKDPDGAFKKLPKEIQARYGPYPYRDQGDALGGVQGEAEAVEDRPHHVPGRLAVACGRDQAGRYRVQQGQGQGPGRRARCRSTSSRATRRRRPSSRSTPSSRWCVTGSTASCFCRLPGLRSHRRSTRPARRAFPSSSSTTSSAEAKYAVNVWSQNNSPAAAGVAGLVKTGNVLFVRGIAGNPVEQAFQDAAVADVKACPGSRSSARSTASGRTRRPRPRLSSGSPRIPTRRSTP